MEPRPLLELNVEQAIAGILQKPRWWIKSQDPEICWKWMSEVEYQFLTTTFQQSLVNWSHGQGPILDLNDLLVEPEGPEKQTKLREWLKGIVTEFGMDGEADEYSDLESVSDDDDEKTEEKQEDIEEVADNDGVKDLSEDEARKLRALKLKVSAQESYPTIKWTLNQLLLHEELSRTPVEEWTTDTIHHALDQAEHLSHPALISRATELVIAVRRGVSIHEALSIPPGSDLLSADHLLELKLHCEKIQRELSSVKAYIMRSLFLIAEKEGLRADTASEKIVFCPAGIDGVWISDNLIPQDVATKFIKEVAVLENVPDDKKDWHPHSNRQVLDLVHPSLFCCVFGQTMRVPNALDPSSYTTPSEQMHRLMFLGSKVVKKPQGCSTDYQWIPTDFEVGEGGEAGSDRGNVAVRILSYINNLHPEQHADLYESIGSIFGRFVPLFERMLAYRTGLLKSSFDVDTISHDSWRALPRRPRLPELVELPKKAEIVNLRGKTLQAIVKIAEIILTPENPEYGGGAWHIEGTPSEKIIGTGIYYFDCENIQDSRLSFRSQVEEPPYQQSDDAGIAEIYGLFNEELLVQDFGSVQTLASRCLVFPNLLQHQVQPFKLDNPSKPGVRKILAFFLVDPDDPIPSTSVIPPQQEEWIEPTLEVIMENLHLVDAVERNIHSLLPRGMSLLVAKQHRLQLMAERAAQEDEEDSYGNPRYFSLCEH